MLYIFDKDENLLEILSQDDFWDDIYKRQLNKEWSFTTSVPIKTSSNIKRRNKIGFYDRDNVFQLFTIDEVSDAITIDGDERVVYAPHDFYKLGEKIIEDRRIINSSCREALEKALDGTIYKVGEVADLGLNTLNFYYITSLEALNKIIETYGGELNFRLEMNEDKSAIANRYVDILYRQGEDTGIRYTLDTNIIELNRNDIVEGHYNILYGRGASLETEDGGYTRLLDFSDVVWSKPNNPTNKPLKQKYIEDIESIKKYGKIEGIYENKDITDPSELLQATYDALQECKDAKYNYSAKVEDIYSKEEYSHFKARLGDTIHILDEEYDFNEECRIIEERYPISDMNDIYIEMGYFLPGITDISPSLPGGGSISNGNESKPEIDIDNFPDTLPSIPIVNAKGGFAAIALDWTYENKLYYDYEVYASQLENFTPDLSNLIFRGKSSVLLHEVKPSQTWYYRVRAINSHGRYTNYSNQVSASTKKISDAAQYFEELAINDALIGQLSLDRSWIGQLDATYLNVKGKLTVTDGNGRRTFHIDSFGLVDFDANTIRMSSSGTLDINTNNYHLSNVEMAFKRGGIKTYSIKRGYGHLYNPQDSTLMGALVPRSVKGGEYFDNGISCMSSYNSYYFSIAKANDWNNDNQTTFSPTEFIVINFRDRGSNLNQKVGMQCFVPIYANAGINMNGASIINSDTITSNNISAISYRHPNGSELFSSYGGDITNMKNWNWNGKNLVNANIVRSSFGLNVINNLDSHTRNSMTTFDAIKVVNSNKRINDISLDVSKVANKESLLIDDENIDMGKLVTLLVKEIKELKDRVKDLESKVSK